MTDFPGLGELNLPDFDEAWSIQAKLEALHAVRALTTGGAPGLHQALARVDDDRSARYRLFFGLVVTVQFFMDEIAQTQGTTILDAVDYFIEGIDD